MKTIQPYFLYGTAWKESDTQRCVEAALAAGFRAIDTANQRKHYHEAGVGDALKKCFSEGWISRKEIYLQTKFTSIRSQDERLPYDKNAPLDLQVQQSFASSLEHLHTDYLDSYILHGPSQYHVLSDADLQIWGSMERLYHQGKVHSLGISNVNLEQLKSLYEKAHVKPVYVQNRCFAQLGWDREVRAFCKSHEIIYQGFSLLTANPEVFHHQGFREILKRANCTPAQLVFRFAQKVGMLPLTGTTDPIHMLEDLKSENLELNLKDIQTMENLLG